MSSDFRTHITEKRWTEYLERLNKLQTLSNERKISRNYLLTNQTEFQDGTIYCQFNNLKGMTVERIGLNNKPYLFGKVAHGFFSRMDMCSDWYSGNTVFQPPGKSQTTDLSKTDILRAEDNLSTSFQCKNNFLEGAIEKTFTFSKNQSTLEVDYGFHLTPLSIGSLRFCYLTFNPDEIDENSFELTSHAGGIEPSIYKLPKKEFNHGENPTNVVSSNNLIPVTENYFTIKTKTYLLKVEILSATHTPGLMAKFKKSKEGNLFRLFFSLSEYDETRKSSWDFKEAHVQLKLTLQER